MSILDLPVERGKIRVVKERDSVYGQFVSQLNKVTIDDICLGMHQRVKTEGKLNRSIHHHVERATVIDVIFDRLLVAESFPARVDTSLTHVDKDHAVTKRSQESRPPSETWRNL